MAFLHMNLKALVIAVASGAVAGALSMLIPGIQGSRFEDLFIASVFAVCATFAERRGWKGRLLAIPLWFFAWGAVTVALFSLGSGWIALGILTGLATVLAGLMAIAAHDDAQKWAKAPEAFLRAKEAALLDDRGAMWLRILESFHVPSSHTFPPEVCAHDIEVLRFVRAQAPIESQPGALGMLDEAFEEWRAAPTKSVRIDSRIVDPVVAWMTKMAEAYGKS